MKNFQGRCKLPRLRTGRITTREKFTMLPMPQYVAHQVEDMETLENHDEDLVFTDRNGTIIADNDTTC